MTVNSIKFAFIILLAGIICSAQDIGTWKSYTSKKEVVKMTSSNEDQIWCATNGGAFMYERSSNTYLQLAPSEGLSSPIISSIAIDKSNQVWFGTQLGASPGMLNVYNFSDGTVRKINDILRADYTQKSINNLATLGDTVLASTEFGLALINTSNYSFYDTFLKFGNFEALRSVHSAAFFDRFFISLDDGIAVQKIGSTNLTAPEAWNTYRFGNEISASFGYEFVQFNGKVLLATPQGIFEFASNNWQSFLMEGIDVVNLFTYGSDLYFVTRENSVNKIYSYDGSTINLVFENPENYKINDLLVVSSQVIYAGTNSGLLEINGASTNLLFPAGPANNAFVAIDVDDDGTVWSATGRDGFGIGVMHYDGNEWDLIDKNDDPSITSNDFNNVFVADNGKKYFCSWGFGLTVYDNENITTYDANNTPILGIPDAPTFIVVEDAKIDSKGNIWILNHWSAGPYPLSMITPEGEVYNFEFTNPRVTSNELAYHLEIDQFDTKWFSITDGDIGLYYFNENGTYDNPNDDEMGILRRSDGLQSSSITTLKLDERGSLWVGTNSGVSVIPDPSNPTSRISTVNGLRQQSIAAIEVDPLNQKWVATPQGLFHLSEDGFAIFNQYTSEATPIPSNDIKSLAIDENSGLLYIGTDFGLTSLKTSSVAPSGSMENLFIYPNPVTLKESSTLNITVEGLAENSTIKVLSISGELLREIETPGGNIGFWDGKDDEGNFVPSGIYLLIAYDEDGSNVATGKVAVLRE